MTSDSNWTIDNPTFVVYIHDPDPDLDFQSYSLPTFEFSDFLEPENLYLARRNTGKTVLQTSLLLDNSKRLLSSYYPPSTYQQNSSDNLTKSL
jgi:hypothetical protein